MEKDQGKYVFIFLTLWTAIIVMLFTHTSGLWNIKLLNFPQSKGNIIFLEVYNKNTNILGLGDTVIAIPHGVPFIHPKRKKKMLENRVFSAASLQEARKMVDARKEQIEGRLVKANKTLSGVEFFYNKQGFYGVPAVNAASGNPDPLQGWPAFTEKFLGKDIESSEEFISSKKWLE